MNFKGLVKWMKTNLPISQLDPMYITETNNTFMISRPIVQPDALEAYVVVKQNGFFITIYLLLDRPQDQPLVQSLPKEFKAQLKGSFPSIKLEFTIPEASEKARLLFDSTSSIATDFFEQYKELFVWTLPIKEKKKKE